MCILIASIRVQMTPNFEVDTPELDGWRSAETVPSTLHEPGPNGFSYGHEAVWSEPR